jgi:hypothetical protein
MRLGPVRIYCLGSDELRGSFDEGGLLLRCQRQQVGSGESPRRLDANRANRIVEQAGRQLE